MLNNENKKEIFITNYGEHLQIATPTGDKKMTKDSFKDECDINNIMAKFNKTGELPDMIKREPRYGDFSDPLSFQEAQNLIIHAGEQFEALPAKVRERFKNDPESFLRWVHEEASEEEMQTMGLLKEKQPEPIEAKKEGEKKDSKTPKKPEPKNSESGEKN